MGQVEARAHGPVSPREVGNGADEVSGAEPWLLAGVAIGVDLVACTGELGSVVLSAGADDPPVAVEFAGAPLRLYERGMWIPGDEYWGEPGDAFPVPLVEVIAGCARRGYEFEQLLPGGDDPDPRYVIGEALALRNRGQLDRADALLQGVTLCSALLWLDPGDQLGASDLLAKLIAAEPWHP